MSEPTIDEMLAWLKRFDYTAGGMPNAISAILEQHRDLQAYVERVEKLWDEHDQRELEAVRAFVERVEKRWQDYLEPSLYIEFVADELAAMEAEVKE